MKRQERLTRGVIVQTLVEALQPLDYVHAFYEGGAAAFNRIDEWSDIDLYAVVDDDKVNDTFLTVEKALKSLSIIKQKYDVPQTGWPGVFQAFYRLKNTSEYLIIDFAVLKLCSQDTFLEPEIHGDVVFLFNKKDKVKRPQLDRDAFIKKVCARLERLRARFDMFNSFIQKEINRGNTLEALDLYHAITLGTLVETLRIRHNPLHHDFKMRYVHYELPQETIRKLGYLHFVKDKEDLQQKYLEASNWFNEITLEVSRKQVEELVRIS